MSDTEEGARIVNILDELQSLSQSSVETERTQCEMGVRCPEHDFIHGAEAEELRQRLEALITEAQKQDRNIGPWELQRILDDVGADEAEEVSRG